MNINRQRFLNIIIDTNRVTDLSILTKISSTDRISTIIVDDEVDQSELTELG